MLHEKRGHEKCQKHRFMPTLAVGMTAHGLLSRIFKHGATEFTEKKEEVGGKY
jgi:hypothetical protein